MKFLIVTANFAPRGASPAIRTVHLVKFLSLQGHDVRVLTYDNNALTLFSAEDDALSRKVPPTVKVDRIPAGPLRRLLFSRDRESRARAKLVKRRHLANPLISLLIPDPHVDAVPAFIRTAAELTERHKPDVIITHGYPFSMHWVGSTIKRRFPELFWIADYGDPWTSAPTAELNRPAWRKSLDKRIEASWLSRADMITVTTAFTKRSYEREFKFLGEKVRVLPMGYDPDDFVSSTSWSLPPELAGKFLFVHTGRIYPAARDPAPFVQAMERLALDAPALFRSINVVLVGEEDEEVRRLVNVSTAKNAFVFVPWVPMEESIAWMKAADCLLLFGNKGGMQIPGKVYQYLGARRPIFMTLLASDDPTVQIVSLASGSEVINNSVEELATAIARRVAGGRPSGTSCTAGAAGDPFSWPTLVAQLARAVKSRLATTAI